MIIILIFYWVVKESQRVVESPKFTLQKSEIRLLDPMASVTLTRGQWLQFPEIRQAVSRGFPPSHRAMETADITLNRQNVSTPTSQPEPSYGNGLYMDSSLQVGVPKMLKNYYSASLCSVFLKLDIVSYLN